MNFSLKISGLWDPYYANFIITLPLFFIPNARQLKKNLRISMDSKNREALLKELLEEKIFLILSFLELFLCFPSHFLIVIIVYWLLYIINSLLSIFIYQLDIHKSEIIIRFCSVHFGLSFLILLRQLKFPILFLAISNIFCFLRFKFNSL